MSNLIIDSAVAENHWVNLADDDALPAGANVIVSYSRYNEQANELAAHNGDVTFRLMGDDNLADAATKLDGKTMVAVEFPKFADGRCYSYARLLRDRYGFTGEIRAVGDVLRDQLFYMSRVGINAFEIRADRDAQDALASLKDFSVKYQAANDESKPIYLRRG